MGGTAEIFRPSSEYSGPGLFYTDSGFREKMEVNLFMNERLETSDRKYQMVLNH